MLTKHLDVKGGEYSSAIETAAQILRDGGTVAIPTETVYGLAASAYSDSAITKVFDAKGRPQDNPLIVHIADLEMLESIAVNIPKTAFECANRFWPGPLTMILEKSENIAESVSAGLNTVAVRIPSDTVARDIIKKSGLPLAAPSANVSGAPSPTTAAHVVADLDGKIDAVVFGDDCSVGVESTVITLVEQPPRILRPGAVTVEQLREILPDIVIDSAVLTEPEENARVASPGMKYKHYAPKTQTYLVEGSSALFADFVNSKKDCAVLCFKEEYDAINTNKIVYGTCESAATLAKNLFSALREVDSFGVKAVYVHAPQKKGVGLAVYNRLIRAAGFRVIKL